MQVEEPSPLSSAPMQLSETAQRPRRGAQSGCRLVLCRLYSATVAELTAGDQGRRRVRTSPAPERRSPSWYSACVPCPVVIFPLESS